ncbi:MAG: hypothetical protein UZ05_CHB002002781 [Chlorobi bacterium OLB5]|nr:MAG: hypothetical protein UZ05_CHB002002781 [Chlorobi bacterium OLB5]
MRDIISDEARIRHISDAITNIENFTADIGISDFLSSNLIKSATVRQMEIIGEGVNHLSEELKEKYTEINWIEIVSFRNIAIHEYFVIDYAVIWNIIENYIPELKITIEKIIKNEFNKQ